MNGNFALSRAFRCAIPLAAVMVCAFIPETTALAAEPVVHEATASNHPWTSAEMTIRIIPSANQTFGYDILVHGRPLIHQPNIPGLPGHEGFATREKARKVAEFVVQKIRNGKMPPSVDSDDLNALGALE
jgi:hypothetical protein